jgi:hypothetical protein
LSKVARWLAMSSAEKLVRPFARAIKIYCSVAKRRVDVRTRRGLARHIKSWVDRGVEDQSRLTVHGLDYLRSQEQASRRASGDRVTSGYRETP